MDPRKQARRERAASRLQSPRTTAFPSNWSEEQIEQALATVQKEFVALCRVKAISLSNVEAAAHNVLLGVHPRLPLDKWKYWLRQYVGEGRNAAAGALV